MESDTAVLWPLVAYSLSVLVLTVGIVTLSFVLGQRHAEPGTSVPYESGMPPTGSARLRFPSDFYLIAMFFVIYSVASIFIFAWAVVARQAGWSGYAILSSFILLLVAALAYLWRVGALDWRASGRQTQPEKEMCA